MYWVAFPLQMPPSPIYHIKHISGLSFKLFGICFLLSGYHITLSFSKPISVIVLKVYLSYDLLVLLSLIVVYLIPYLYKIFSKGLDTNSTC